MKPFMETNTLKLYHGDAIETLRCLDADSVDCVVTSPPYWGLRDYQLEPTVWDGVEGCEHVWGELQPQDSRHVYTMENSGKEGVVAGKEAYPKGRGSFCALCGAWRGTLGLEPTPQLFVQHLVLVFREVWRVLKPTGTVWLNLGDSYSGSHGTGGNPGDKQYTQAGSRSVVGRPDVAPGLKPKDLVGIPWRVAFALQDAGWWLRSDIIWSKPNPMPESVTDRPTKAHEYMFLLTKAERYYYDAEAVKEKGTGTEYDLINRPAARMEGADSMVKGRRITKTGSTFGQGSATRNRRSVWTIPTQSYADAHFATFPEKLVEPCILAGCPPKVCAMCYNVVNEQTQITKQDTVQADVPGMRDILRGEESSVLQPTLREEGIRARAPQATEAMRSMFTADDGTSKNLLQSEMLGGMEASEWDTDASPTARECELELEGRDNEGPGVCVCADAGTSECTEERIHRGTPPCDVDGAWAATPPNGVRAPSQWQQDGQSPGESPGDDSEPTQGRRDVSPLRGGFQHSVSPCCGAKVIPGTVMDPFGGSGTVGLVAQNLGRHAVLIEASEEYCGLAANRLAQTVMAL